MFREVMRTLECLEVLEIRGYGMREVRLAGLQRLVSLSCLAGQISLAHGPQVASDSAENWQGPFRNRGNCQRLKRPLWGIAYGW